MHYKAAKKLGMTFAEWFWLNVDASGGKDACWPWRGGNDYGEVTHNGKRWGAHRMAYALVKGPLWEEQLVCHSCDNPPCCNPAHLWTGTHQDNMTDMVIKKRGKGGRLRILTDAQITEARTLAEKPGADKSAIARQLGVGRTTLYRALGYLDKPMCSITKRHT